MHRLNTIKRLDKNGLFSQTLDPSEFQHLIELVLDDPSKYKTIKQNAIKTAENYNYNNFRKKLYHGYEQAVSLWKENR